MPRPSLLILAACALYFSANSAGAAEPWESTLTPLPSAPAPEIKPVRVKYHFGWNGIIAATGDLHLTRTAEHLQLETTGATTGLVRTLWRFDVTNVSTSDARTLRPLQVHEIETTRGRKLDTHVEYFPEKAVSHREEQRDSKTKTKDRTFDFPNALSLESAMLVLRTRPLAVGAVERVVVYPATSPYLCTLSVLGHERLTVAAGSYDAIKVDLQLSKIGRDHRLEPHKKFKRGTIWLTNDPEHLVLRVEVQAFVGTVFAELQSVQSEAPKP